MPKIKLYTYKGKKRTMAAIMAISGTKNEYQTIISRIARGWSMKRALEEPANRNRKTKQKPTAEWMGFSDEPTIPLSELQF